MNRALHALLLVFAFLFAQAGLAAHTASHFVTQNHGSDQSLPADAPCELCVGYAQVAGGALLPVAPSPPVCTAHFEAPQTVASLLVFQDGYRSRARAPPVFS